MNIVKTFLSAEELSYIITELNKQETALQREIVKVGLVCQMCVDYFIEHINEFSDCGEIYNKAQEDGVAELLPIHIRNYYVIDKIFYID